MDVAARPLVRGLAGGRRGGSGQAAGDSRILPTMRWKRLDLWRSVRRRGMLFALACMAASVPGCLAVIGTGIELVLGAGALSNALLLPFAGGTLAWLASVLI